MNEDSASKPGSGVQGKQGSRPPDPVKTATSPHEGIRARLEAANTPFSAIRKEKAERQPG